MHFIVLQQPASSLCLLQLRLRAVCCVLCAITHPPAPACAFQRTCVLGVQVLYVELCIAAERLKPAARAVRLFGLQEEFPDVVAMYLRCERQPYTPPPSSSTAVLYYNVISSHNTLTWLSWQLCSWGSRQRIASRQHTHIAAIAIQRLSCRCRSPPSCRPAAPLPPYAVPAAAARWLGWWTSGCGAWRPTLWAGTLACR